MRISSFSDGHGYLPEISDNTDLVLIAGDILPHGMMAYQYSWLDTTFREWLKDKPPVVATLGNHDILFQNIEPPPGLKCTFLIDNLTEKYGTREYPNIAIYGTPWTKYFNNWAFMDDESGLAQKFAKIPDHTEILLAHSPPYMLGDWSPYTKTHEGSPSLYKRIEQIQPRLVVWGHFHSCRGIYEIPELPNTILANVAILDESYEVVAPPMEFDI